MTTDKPNTIDEYIAGFPADVQEKLQQVRETIKKAAPDATETVKYAMPTFTLNGNLVYFAGFKNHIGFYATPKGNEAFQQELSAYKQGKGSIQFPLDQPMPLDLIARMVTYRVEENLGKATKPKTKKG
ncbi:iron chaperone [Spirosoma sp.]|uniref:iron chaperone n=1 Tax=Spirosoma sp. TaxID=1899569 RepID=UPI003B3AA623